MDNNALFVFECLLRDNTFMSSIDEYIINTIFITKTFDAKNVPQMVLILMTLLTKGDKQSKEFVFKTLAMSMARLLVCMIFVFIYSLVNKPEALAFTCHFMIQYVLFTIFEMSFLLKYIKQAD